MIGLQNCNYYYLGHEEWLERRLDGVSASEIPSIIGVGFERPFDIFERKVNRIVSHQPSFRMQEGIADEAKVAKRYSEATGKTLTTPPTLCVSKDYPWQMATPDRIVNSDSDIFLLEIKNVYGPPNEAWGPTGSEKIPMNYYAQVQQQMGVCKLSRCDVAVNFAGFEFRHYTIRFDREIYSMLTKAGMEFWGKVRQVDQLSPDWESSYSELANSLLSLTEPGSKITLGSSFVALAEEYEQLSAISSEATKRQKQIKEIFAQEMGLAETGLIEGTNITVTRKTIQRKGYTVDPSQYVNFNVSNKKKGKK